MSNSPITLAHYVATFDGATPCEQAAAAARQLAGNAAHFGEQARAYLDGAECAVRLNPATTRVDLLLSFASDAARVAWRFAADAETVWTWHNAGGAR